MKQGGSYSAKEGSNSSIPSPYPPDQLDKHDSWDAKESHEN